jgi:hypothetical protein
MKQPAASQSAKGKPGQPRTAASRKYIYAIIDGLSDFKIGANGIDGRRPELISANGITCVVSENASDHLRPERRYLAVHRDILNWLMARSSAVLPVRFGTMADSESGVRALLSRNHADLVRQLGRVRGKVEMGLRVTWDVPNIFEFFVEHKPELRAERDRLFARRGETDRDERIELGRMFERLLEEERDAFTGGVEEVLTNCCAEIKHNQPRNEREVMNLACLIERDSQPQFETHVLEAAQRFDNNYAFDYNGPWSPHSFVELDLQPVA